MDKMKLDYKDQDAVEAEQLKLVQPLKVEEPDSRHFAWNREEFIKVLDEELSKGHLVKVWAGYDAFGRFDGTYQVLGYVNPYYEACKT